VDHWIARHPEYRYLPLTTGGLWPEACGLGIIQTPQRTRRTAVA
jgi:hypothetical protein